MRTSIHSEFTGNHPAFPHAMGYGLYVISPAIGFLVTVARGKFDTAAPGRAGLPFR